MRNLLLLTTWLILFSCSKDTETETIIEEVCPEPKIGLVKYEVSSQASQLFLTYADDTGDRIVEFVDGSTWTHEFYASAGDLVYVVNYIPETYILTNIDITINGETIQAVGCSSASAATDCYAIALVPDNFPD